MAHFVYAWPRTHIDHPLFGQRPGEWTLPGHNYIGPGNPVPNGYPVDKDDLIALRHDQDYHTATTEEEVRLADREAISEFWKDTKENYNVHSLLGTLGIGIKYGVESVTGVIYPKVKETATLPPTPPATPIKRKNEGEEGTPSKVRIMTNPPGSGTTGQQQDPASSKTAGNPVASSGGGGTGGGSGEHAIGIDGPLTNQVSGILEFRHKRIFTSYGNQFAFCTADNDGLYKVATGKKESLLMTPLACVPVDTVPWYLSPQEFNNLPKGSEIVQVICNIIPYGYRLPFLVNSSGLTYANSQADIIGCFAMGLNNKYNGCNMKYTYADAKTPMMPCIPIFITVYLNNIFNNIMTIHINISVTLTRSFRIALTYKH